MLSLRLKGTIVMSIRNENTINAIQRFSLDSKTALVAGGGGYLGEPICRALAEHGAKVIIADLNVDLARQRSEKLNEDGLNSEAVGLDISDETVVKEVCDKLASKYGSLDIAVNTTCYSTGKPMEEMSLQEWCRGMRVSLDGAFVFSREAGKLMAARGKGSIIQFSSMYGKVSPDPSIYGPKYNVNPVDYGVAKAGILQMVRYQAVMLGKKGVRVNSIIPGPFPNPAGQGADKEFVEKLSKKVPLGRVGKAEEIAGAVVFLASDAASFMTGTEIVIDGGWTAW
jgi:NAD(P)-dependent dehydrogenase (short-subunit alcohol dehydrogenase family)